MNNKQPDPPQRYTVRPITTANVNKISNFQFTNISHNNSEGEDFVRRNPRNSFYAQKFKKVQTRPCTSLPESKKRGPITTPTREEDPKNIGMMGSFFVNTKPNTRRISNSLANYQAQLMKRNPSENNPTEFKNKAKSQRLGNKQQSQNSIKKKYAMDLIYSDVVGDLSEYFSMVKLSSHKRNEYKNNAILEKRYVSSQCKTRQIEKCYFPQSNLNIKGLQAHPIRFTNIRKQRKNFIGEDAEKSIKFESYQGDLVLIPQQLVLELPPEQNDSKTLFRNRPTFQKQPNEKLRRFQFVANSSSPQKRQESKSPARKTKCLVDYLGKIKDNSTFDQIQKLKALYYRDLIWKVWFNSNWRVKADSYSSGNLDPPRFFVGRGNNSKLVKALMGRRWWWKLQSKEQNANFLWTQLKIYSAYQSQLEYDKLNIFESDDTVLQKQQKNILQPQFSEELPKIPKTQPQNPQQQTTNAQKIFTSTKTNEETIQKLNLSQSNNLKLLNKVDQSLTLSNNVYKKQAEIYDEEWWNYKRNLDDKNVYLLTYKKYEKWHNYIKNLNTLKKQGKSNELLQNRKILQKNMQVLQKYPEKVTNHLQYSRLIGNKKALYKTMSIYYQLCKKSSRFLPMTYHIQNGLEDPQYLKFLNQYYRRSKQQNNSMWIVKPGQMSNRGCGIKVCEDINQIKKILKNRKTHNNGKSFTYIVQEYIRQPFLYQGRKFDIRHYIMINSQFGRIKGYFYEKGYIRTTSYKYSNKSQDSYVHLTNDAVQKYGKDYGKYQKGNKVSYQQFEKYLKGLPEAKQKGYSFFDKILPKIRQISIDIINASYYIIDPKRKGNNFQVFGLDVMIDSEFRPWLIEVNTNPCLELSSPVLSKVIPRMLDNAFAISLDPLFPPPADVCLGNKKNSYPENYVNQNRFQLVFDEVVDGKKLNRVYEEIKDQLSQMEGYGSDQEAYESAEDDYDAQY